MITSEQIRQEHVRSALSSYSGNLRGIVEAIQEGQFPDEKRSRFPKLLAEFQEYLAARGTPESDHTLLCYGLIVPGLQRGIQPPLECIFPERGGFSDKRKEEAAAQVERIRAALALIRYIWPNSSADTRSALLAVSGDASPTPSDEQWVAMHTNLSADEFTFLSQRALHYLDHSSRDIQQIGTNILAALADFRHDGLGTILAELLIRKVYYPASLFRDAPAEITNRLLEQIQSEPSVELLMALAWTRSETAANAFRQWRRTAPAWAIGRLAAPEEFLPAAGWHLDGDGQRRELVSLHSYRLVPTATAETSAEVRCRENAGQRCPNCRGPLSWLFDFSNIPEKMLAPNQVDMPRRILTCLHCACYGVVYTRLSPNGGSEIHPATPKSEFTYTENRLPVTLYLIDKPWPPFAGARPFSQRNASSLRGVPSWVQSAEYPICPECEEAMPFVAQLDCGIEPHEEGLYYAFHCDRCRIGSVNYQQT